MYCAIRPCRRQDQELDDLSSHVVRIGELGKEMGQELHVQGQLLDELDQGGLQVTVTVGLCECCSQLGQLLAAAAA